MSARYSSHFHSGRGWLGFRAAICVIFMAGSVWPATMHVTHAQSSHESPSPFQSGKPPLVSIDGGLLTISAHDASLQDILTEIGRAGGIEIEVHGMEGQNRVSQAFVARPLSDGLNELLNGRNYLLLYRGHGRDKRLTKVILGSGSVSSAVRPSQSSSPATTAYPPESRDIAVPEPPRSPRPDFEEQRPPTPVDPTAIPGPPSGNQPGPPPGVTTQPSGPIPFQPSSPFPYLNAIQQQNQAKQSRERVQGSLQPGASSPPATLENP